jgi:hypothetical protein
MIRANQEIIIKQILSNFELLKRQMDVYEQLKDIINVKCKDLKDFNLSKEFDQSILKS